MRHAAITQKTKDFIVPATQDIKAMEKFVKKKLCQLVVSVLMKTWYVHPLQLVVITPTFKDSNVPAMKAIEVMEPLVLNRPFLQAENAQIVQGFALSMPLAVSIKSHRSLTVYVIVDMKAMDWLAQKLFSLVANVQIAHLFVQFMQLAASILPPEDSNVLAMKVMKETVRIVI